MKNLSSDTHKGSSELGSGHIETTRSEITDAASVSSGIVCVGLSKDSFPISIPQSKSVVQSNNEVNVVALIKVVEFFQETMLRIVYNGLHLLIGIKKIMKNTL